MRACVSVYVHVHVYLLIIRCVSSGEGGGFCRTAGRDNIVKNILKKMKK